MAKQDKNFQADYNMAHVVACPAKALLDAEDMVAALLDLKRENYNAMDAETQEKTTKADPEYNDSVGYNEVIPTGYSRTTLETQFIKIAKQYGLEKGRITLDTMLISGLAYKSQRWIATKDKHDPHKAMPNFLVRGVNEDGTMKDVKFFVAAKKSLSLDGFKAGHTDILSKYRAKSQGKPITAFKSAPVNHEKGGETKEISQPQQFHEDVSKAHALSEDAKKAAADLERSREKAELEALRAENAKLKATTVTDHQPLVMPKTPSIAAPDVPNGIVH